MPGYIEIRRQIRKIGAIDIFWKIHIQFAKMYLAFSGNEFATKCENETDGPPCMSFLVRQDVTAPKRSPILCTSNQVRPSKFWPNSPVANRR